MNSIFVPGLVVIHVDALRRELPYSHILSVILKRLGYDVILTSRRTTRRFLRLIAPEVIVMPHTFTLANYSLNAYSKRSKIYVSSVESVGNESYQYVVDFAA